MYEHRRTFCDEPERSTHTSIGARFQNTAAFPEAKQKKNGLSGSDTPIDRKAGTEKPRAESRTHTEENVEGGHEILLTMSCPLADDAMSLRRAAPVTGFN